MEVIPPALLVAQQQLCVSFASGDAAGVAAVYAEAGQIMPAYTPAIRGRAAIQAFWQGCIDMGICTMQRIPLEVDALAGTINEMGEYRFFARQQHLLDVGKYLIIWKEQVIWKEQGGQWQIQCDIWTSNSPSGYK